MFSDLTDPHTLLILYIIIKTAILIWTLIKEKIIYVMIVLFNIENLKDKFLLKFIFQDPEENLNGLHRKFYENVK